MGAILLSVRTRKELRVAASPITWNRIDFADLIVAKVEVQQGKHVKLGMGKDRGFPRNVASKGGTPPFRNTLIPLPWR